MSWECNCAKALERDESFPGVYCWCPFCGRKREHVDMSDFVHNVLGVDADINALISYGRRRWPDWLPPDRRTRVINGPTATLVIEDEAVSVFVDPGLFDNDAKDPEIALAAKHRLWATEDADGGATIVALVAVERWGDSGGSVAWKANSRAPVCNTPLGDFLRDYVPYEEPG